MTELAVPCRHMVVCPTLWHTCTLLEGAVCQVINPYLTDITMKGVIKPSEVSITGHPDKANLAVAVTAHETEILSVERPPEIPVLDTKCPAGYTWQQACAKFEALAKLCPEDMNDRGAQRINAWIRRMHKTNIKGTLDQYMEAEIYG